MHLDIVSTPLDLALQAARKRQSPRTGFVHFFYGNDSALDTIPFYENVCFAIALLHQKKAETVLEGKDLLTRLLSFQTKEGNFPVYLHDYPNSFALLLGLRVAPLLLRALTVPSLGAECKELVTACLHRIFSFYEAQKTARSPLWEYRYQMCKAVMTQQPLPQDTLEPSQFSASDWWEYWVTKQFEQTAKCTFYHPHLQRCIGPFLFDRAQEGLEPSLTLIDWMCSATSETVPSHPLQMGLSALEGLEVSPIPEYGEKSWTLLTHLEKGNLQLLWKKEHVHTLCLEVLGATVSADIPGTYRIELPPTFTLQRDDLFEVAFYVDVATDRTLCINGVKGTAFQLGDWVQVTSAEGLSLRFDLLEGEGDFCGHIYRSNRSNQRLDGEAFDWKIGLRTLRRSEKCVLKCSIAHNFIPFVIQKSAFGPRESAAN